MPSRKRFSTTPLHPLMLNGLHLNKMEYVGVLISSDLSWTPHIRSVCSKAKQILGLLYRRFYNHVKGDTIKQLYLSLVKPHLEYACPVWDPHTMKDKVLLEDLQKFAFRMATKQWDLGYQDLLDTMNVYRLLLTADSSLNFPCCTRLFMVCATSLQIFFVLVLIIVH